MTGKERVLKCLKGEPADRVPITFVPMDGYIARTNGKELWEFAFADIDTQYEMQAEYMRRHPQNDFLYAWAGQNRSPVKDRKVVCEEGRLYIEWMDNGEREILDRTGTGGLWKPRMSAGYMRPPPPSREEIERNILQSDEWLPAVDGLYCSETYQCVERLVKTLGSEKYTAFNLSALVPSAYNVFGGLTEGLTAIAEDPQFFEAVLERVTELFFRHIRAAARTGVDGAWLGLFNEALDFLDPKFWRKVIAPYQNRVVEECHKNGIKCHMWLLGDFLPIAGELADMQPDSIALDQDRNSYSSDPTRYRDAVGSGICIHGWVWEMDLVEGNRKNIRDTVGKQIREMGYSRFMMGTPPLTWDMNPCELDYFCGAVAEECEILHK